MKTGIELITNERQEQIEKHGRTVEQDKKLNTKYQLSTAATTLIEFLDEEDVLVTPEDTCPEGWDLNVWRKMWYKSYHERLIIAGALIAAEIDRIVNK